MKRINTITLVNTAYKNNPVFEEIDTAYVPWENNSMEEAFANCVNLTTVLRLNNNVSNMVNAFANCSSLVNVSIPSSVVNMSYSFDNCELLEYAPTIPSSVETMHGTFKNCSNLTQVLSIPNSVRDLSFSFLNCQSLQNAPTFVEDSNVITLESSFKQSGIQVGPNLVNCTNLVDMRETFFGCTNMIGIPLIPDSVTNLSYTFAWCNNFVGKIDEIEIEEKPYYGYICNEGSNPILSFSLGDELGIGSVIYLTEFYGHVTDDYKIDYENDENYEKYYVVREYGENDFGITEESNIIDYETYDVENVEDIIRYTIERDDEYDFVYEIISEISSDKTLDIPNSVTNMTYTFARCSNLEVLPNFDNATSITNLSGCFRECESLYGTPNFSNCNEISDIEGTFYNCYSINDGVEKDFYGWEEINEGTYFATNDEFIENNDNLYEVSKITVGEDLYAFVNDLDEDYIYYTKSDNPVVGDKIYRKYNDALQEYDTIKTISLNEDNELVIEFNNYELTASRYEYRDEHTSIQYNINDNSRMKIISNTYDEEEDYYNITYIDENDETEHEINIRRFFNIDITRIVYGQIILPNNTINMKETFYGCRIIKTPFIPNSVTNMSHTFAYCNNLSYTTIIPDSVTNMSHTFAYCNNLKGDIYINSAVVTNAINCFCNTSLEKNVYIPFSYQNGEYTPTYNSFLAADYSTSVRKDGALLINIDSDDIELDDYQYNMDESRNVELYNYINIVKEDIKTPNVTPQG